MARRRGRAEDAYQYENEELAEDVEEGAPDPLSLGEYFSTEDDGDRWILRCRKCGRSYGLLKLSAHIGNRQKLVMHARTHSDLEML